ncbi:MAG: hypothetical protein WD049_06085, partial [Candidatus Paceibacterota bacterium]
SPPPWNATSCIDFKSGRHDLNMRPLRPERTGDERETQRITERNAPDAEPLHQWLHQKPESVQREAVELLRLFVELSDDERVQLLDALRHQQTGGG